MFAKELTDVEMFWVRGTQLAEFSHEISTLKAGKELAASSRQSDSKRYTLPVVKIVPLVAQGDDS